MGVRNVIFMAKTIENHQEKQHEHGVRVVFVDNHMVDTIPPEAGALCCACCCSCCCIVLCFLFCLLLMHVVCGILELVELMFEIVNDYFKRILEEWGSVGGKMKKRGGQE